MRRRLLVPVFVALLLPGCFFQKVNQRLAEAPEARPWAGQLYLGRQAISWDAGAVGVGIQEVYQRVDATTWRGPASVFQVDGRYVRGPNLVIELVDTERGFDVRLSGGGPTHGYWEFLDQAEPEPAAQGRVRLARYKRPAPRDMLDMEGVYVPADQVAQGAPWPQLGFALLAHLGGAHAGIARSGAGAMARLPVGPY